MDIFKVILSNGKTIIFGKDDSYENNEDTIVTNQYLYLDDSIQTIKNKIIIALNYEYSYDEIYLFSKRENEINKSHIYYEINDKNENISKDNFQDFMNNIVDQDYEKKDFYTYDDLMNLPNVLESEVFVGNKFQKDHNYLLSIDPRKITKKVETNVYSSDSSLLLNFISNSNTLYLVFAEEILNPDFNKSIQKEYLISIYYQNLFKKGIFSLSELIKNKESLKKETKNKITKDLIKVYQLVDKFYEIYDITKEDPIQYNQIGVKYCEISIKNNMSSLFPLFTIFKNIHASKDVPFIKYNPGLKRDTMYRFYSEKLSKNGDKMPYLPITEIMKFVKELGKSDEIVMVIKHIFHSNPMNIILIIKKNGDINVLLNFSELQDIELDSAKFKLQDIMNECVNPILVKMNEYMEPIGYEFNYYSNFNNSNIGLQNLELNFNLKINKKINFKKYREFLSCMFYIVSSETNKIYFKRVENYVIMNPEDEFISNEFKKKSEMDDIVLELINEFSLDRSSAEEKIKNFISNHKILNGELLENSGFPLEITLNNNTNILNISIKNINSIFFVNLFMKYIHSFIYLYQYPEKISKILDSIVKLTKKEIDYEKIEQLTKTNLDIDKKTTTIQFDDEIDTDFFSNNKKEEEIYGIDDEEEDEIYGMDDNDEEEEEDDEMEGGNGDELEINLEGMNIKNPNPFQKRIEDREPNLVLKKKEGKYNPYSVSCQSNLDRQPVIVDDDEMKKINENHRDSYNEAIKYGSDPNKQYWYLCPRYWNLKTNTSLSEEQVKEILKKEPKAIIPPKTKILPKGSYIYEFNHPKEHLDSNNNYIYHFPGLQKESHPKGYLLPCCFKKKKKDEKTDEKEIKKEKQQISYVVASTIYPLSQNRMGFLPNEVQLFMDFDNKSCVDKSNPSIIKPNSKCLIRYGVEQDSLKSLLGCYADLYGYIHKIPSPSIENMIKILHKSIELDDFIKIQNGSFVSLFHLKDASMDIDFKNYENSYFMKSIDMSRNEEKSFLKETIISYENFRNFLLDSYSIIDHNYFWSVLSEPNKNLLPKGINIIILEINENNTIDLLCPKNIYQRNIFDENRDSWILLKQNQYYEPIYLYDGKQNYTRLFSKSIPNKTIHYILENVKTKINKYCNPKPSLSEIYKYKKPQYLKTLIDLCEKYNIEIKNEIMNYQAKIVGLLVHHKKDLIMLPCFPSSYEKYEILFQGDNMIINNYKKTKELLENINLISKREIECKPIKKVVKNKTIVGILTECNQFIKTDNIELEKISDELEIENSDDYLKVEKAISRDLLDKKRIDETNKIYLESQYYNIFRSTIRILLSQPINRFLKSQINSIISSEEIYIKKIENLYNLLRKLGKSHIEFLEIDIKNVDKDEIMTCFTNCDDKPNCKSINNECVLALPINNLYKKELLNEKLYYTRISDELLRFSRIRSFVMEPKRYLNLSNGDYKVNKNEILLLDSVVKSEYLNELVLFDNKYLKNIDYENAELENNTFKKKIELNE